jgi:hypothetical protein
LKLPALFFVDYLTSAATQITYLSICGGQIHNPIIPPILDVLLLSLDIYYWMGDRRLHWQGLGETFGSGG